MKPSVQYALFLLAALAMVASGAQESQPAGFFSRLFGATRTPLPESGTGGSNCVGCVLILGVVEQLAELYNSSVETAVERLCTYLPSSIQPACKLLVTTYGPVVIELLEQKETPDVVCHAVGICKAPAGTAMCHLFPLPSALQQESTRPAHRTQHIHVAALRQRALDIATAKDLHLLRESLQLGAPPKYCEWPVISEICKIIDQWTGDHLPADDLDGDKFSDLETARGSSWRGKDCNDSDAAFYPGRKAIDRDVVSDSNCNGIFGVDPASGKPYEELYCNGTSQRGTMVLGDSIGAHFHIPRAWLNVTEMSEAAFEHLIFILANELDWPELSMATGHYNASRWQHAIQGPMDSIYQRLFELNRCNHRDYQNVAVNGARSTAMADNIVKSMARHPVTDEPLMIILELVGNDVCSGHPGTSHMTPPDVFYNAEMATLNYLDDNVPKGTHVLLVGLVDGRFLYNNMHARVHPIGALRGDVTYKDVYGYLECNGVTPCWGWLNANETWRNATTEHAFLLNTQLERIANNATFKNIDVLYMIYDIQAAADVVIKEGGQAWQLVEPVDGFHANQLGNAVGASLFWGGIAKSKPGWLPAENLHNAAIVEKFGDQGGY